MWSPFMKFAILASGRFDLVVIVDANAGVRLWMVKWLDIQVTETQHLLATNSLVSEQLVSGFPFEITDLEGLSKKLQLADRVSFETVPFSAFFRIGKMAGTWGEFVARDADSPLAVGDLTAEFTDCDYEWHYDYVKGGKFTNSGLSGISFVDAINYPDTGGRGNLGTSFGPIGLALGHAIRPGKHEFALPSKLRLRGGPGPREFPGVGASSPYTTQDVTGYQPYQAQGPNSPGLCPIVAVDQSPIPNNNNGWFPAAQLQPVPAGALIAIRFGTIEVPESYLDPILGPMQHVPWRPSVVTLEIEGWIE